MAEEDIWDSWEDFADSKDLDKHVDQHLRLTNGNHHEDSDDIEEDFSVKKRNITTSDSFDSDQNAGVQFRILPRPVVHEDDVNRTAYNPQVKILKRPGKDSQANPDKDKQKPQPARTLAEREAAYAEARKRIMGPVEGQTKTSTTSTSKTRPDTRRAKNTKSENSQTNVVKVERLPKGPDKKGRGFAAPR